MAGPVRSSYSAQHTIPQCSNVFHQDRRISWYGISRGSIHDDRTDHTLETVEIITDKFIISCAGPNSHR